MADSPKSIAEMLVDSHAGKAADQMDLEGDESSEGQEIDEGELAAAEEVIDAFKSGNPEAVVMALRSFIAQCR